MNNLLHIFLTFAKVGLFGYGGGPSMIPLMQQEVVEVNRWLSAQEFIDALALGNALPGPIATKMSAYVGYKLSGLPGVMAGVSGTILPSLVAMLALVAVFFRFKDLPQVEAALRAVRPAVVALLVWTAYTLLPQALPQGARSWDAALIGLGTFAVVAFLDVHPAIALLGAGALGLFLYSR
ncbi:MAG: chromate transporter [Chloroflexi bacterium]|nr:chromate transporter [Chloroflexota bacterium]